MLQNLLSAAVVIGSLRVNSLRFFFFFFFFFFVFFFSFFFFFFFFFCFSCCLQGLRLNYFFHAHIYN